MRWRPTLGVVAALLAALVLWRTGALGWAAAAGVAAQRDLQAGLAGAARGLARGDAAAVSSLIGLSALYGVVHAAGPGHGKALLGAAAVAGVERPPALVALALVSALAQALAAVAVIYGGFALLSLSPRAAVAADAHLFAPLGYAMAGLFGLLFAWRGVRQLAGGHDDPCCAHAHHAHHADCGHRPGRQSGGRWGDRLALVAAVAVRPCSGAMIVLALAWMAKAPWAGLAAAVAMALGVAVVTAAAALGGFAVRDASLAAGGARRVSRVAAGLQIAAGGALCAVAASALAPVLAGLLATAAPWGP